MSITDSVRQVVSQNDGRFVRVVWDRDARASELASERMNGQTVVTSKLAICATALREVHSGGPSQSEPSETFIPK